MIVLAIDGLEYDLVEKFDCKNLKQRFYGKTDISEFSEPRTPVLWCSFITGKNKEKEILALGNKEMWNVKIELDKTFFSAFSKAKIIDLPGYNYDKEQHDRERELLKKFFGAEIEEEKQIIKKEYNEHAFKHHKKIKEEFLVALDGDYDFVLGYFSVADVLGHLNFGDSFTMKMIYKELDEIAGRIKDKLIVLSDHGMEAVGQFGDHSKYGFWSTNFKDLGKPRIVDFFNIVKENK